MSEISVIAGVSPSAIRLLEAAGVRRIDNLARQDAKQLFQRLAAINAERGWMGGELTTETVLEWIRNARTVVTGPLRQGQAVAVTADESGDLTLNLDAVPEVIILDHLEGDGSDPTNHNTAGAPPHQSRTPGPAGPDEAPRAIERPAPVALRPTINASHDPNRRQPGAQEWKQVEKEKFQDFSAYVGNRESPRLPGGGSGVGPVPVPKQIPTVSPREPVPRRIRRGVPHPRPFFVLLGAFIVLVCRLLFLAVLIGTPIALVPAFSGGSTHLLMVFLWIIGGWLFSCVLYVLVALRVRCRICTNQIFFSKRCFKNIKAHRVFGLGLVGSLALHAIVFSWFRCMYCGTAIRLKFTGGPDALHPRPRRR